MTRTKNDDVEDGGADPLVRARRQKLDRWRRELGITGYGHRVEGRVSLAEARARFDPAAHEPHTAVTETGQGVSTADSRPRVCVAGRCVQHRAMGKLVFVVLRDDTGDLQVSIAKPH